MIATIGLSVFAPAVADVNKSIKSLIEAGNYLEAINALNVEIASSPNDKFELYFVRARVYDLSDQPEKAKTAYQSLITQYPGRPEAYNNLARLYSREGKLDQATALLRAGLYTQVSYRILFDNLTEIYTEQAARALQSALSPSAPDTSRILPISTLREITSPRINQK
mgnify:FL=1